MKVTNRWILSAALAGVAVALACSGYKSTAPYTPPAPAGIATLRDLLAPYASLNRAKSDGWATALTDCMSNGDLGAMGVHFANTALIDAAVDSLKPEVLIYEPGTDGQMSLVGVEFIIPFAIRPKSAPAPELFGQPFLADDGFQLWGLHVWTQRANPSGLFAPWNPRVHC